jgi:hypothetical protein
MTAALSEHRFKGRDKVAFWSALKETAPATIFPLDVLIETVRSTFHKKEYTLFSLYFSVEVL